jgi:pimeloyl-ACP methyl ester carboxylesterase
VALASGSLFVMNWAFDARSADGVVQVDGGRAVGFATFGARDGVAVLWCHGGPGCRLEPAYLQAEAAAEGLRLIGIDRPGYGMSTPQPGRTIASWVGDAVAVTDALGVRRFVAVGESTGGAYALALAALARDRVLGVVACCSMTDMRYVDARRTMSSAHCHAVWDAPDRDAALAAAVDAHGINGNKMLDGGMSGALAPSDVALFRDAAWMRYAMASFPAMFAHGLEGYTDDRLADGRGWTDFDVSTITCPVTVLHGDMDRVCDIVNAHHTAKIVPHARLVVCAGLGHFSIVTKVIPTIRDLVRQ